MSQPWPMGDKPDTAPFPREVNRAKVDAALETLIATAEAGAGAACPVIVVPHRAVTAVGSVFASAA